MPETSLTRDDLPDDTVEAIERLAARLGAVRGRHYIKIEIRDARFQQASHEAILTRSALAILDAERAATSEAEARTQPDAR